MKLHYHDAMDVLLGAFATTDLRKALRALDMLDAADLETFPGIDESGPDPTDLEKFGEHYTEGIEEARRMVKEGISPDPDDRWQAIYEAREEIGRRENMATNPDDYIDWEDIARSNHEARTPHAGR